jgi:hypothetical protein
LRMSRLPNRALTPMPAVRVSVDACT